LEHLEKVDLVPEAPHQLSDGQGCAGRPAAEDGMFY
jgi:hypothetical protein